MTTEPAQPQTNSIGKLAQLPEAQDDAKVVRGKEGWLFLDNDSNFFMKQHRGELLFTDEQLAEWRTLLEARIAWLEGRDIPYHFMVAPNPHSVYPDMLPFDVPPGTIRPVIQLIDYLKETRVPSTDSPPSRPPRGAPRSPCLFTDKHTLDRIGRLPCI